MILSLCASGKGEKLHWYTLDSSDTITAVSANWPAGKGSDVGRRIWDTFEGPTVKHIYRRIFDSVRSTGDPVSVVVRCDQADRLIELGIVVARIDGEKLSVTIRTLREAPTEYRAIWDPDAVSTRQSVRACAWCQSIHIREGVWMPMIEAVETVGLLRASTPPKITHGICDNCIAAHDLGA